MASWTPEQWMTYLVPLGLFVGAVGKVIIDIVVAVKASSQITKATEKLASAQADIKQDVADNTKITKKGTEAATEHAREAVDTARIAATNTEDIKGQLNGAMDARIRSAIDGHASIQDHGERLTALESQMATFELSLEGVAHNVDSTRHEMRGHMQTIITNQFAAMAGKPLTSPTPSPEDQSHAPPVIERGKP